MLRHIPIVRRADRLAAEIDQRLAARKAQRAANHERARKSAATRIHLAFTRDRLRNESIVR